MSDGAEKTAGGATRSLFGSLGVILITVGVEGISGQRAPLQLGVATLFVILGGLCVYAAFFWEAAKNVLSKDAQDAIGSFAQHRITQFGMLFLVLQTFILSRFVEERRWPFSYPADPSVYAENEFLKKKDEQIRSDAAKYRFSYGVRPLRRTE
jgi:hypothetical protein